MSWLLLLQVALLSCGLGAEAFKLVGAHSPISTSVHATSKEGYALLKNPLKNKGTSFTHKERKDLKIRGLLPGGAPISLETKTAIAMQQFNKKSNPMEKYNFLHTIQDGDETLFYSILINHIQETMPYVYTPTVGQACQEWSHIYRHTPRGLYVTSNDKGHVSELLDNYPNQNIKVIVVTDGERILGLGDLGANGMGIPIGKLALYTACAGIRPEECLPVHIDVGTNRLELHDDPVYMGLKQVRDRSQGYDDLIEEFFTACQHKYGRNVLIQFEDFGNSNAFRLLERYQERANCFNDDIQGTASVALAGLLASLRITKKSDLGKYRYMFYGAGEAGIGIAELLSVTIQQQTGCTLQEARQCSWFVDSQGLITSERAKQGGMAVHKLHYAHDLQAATGGNAPTSGELPSLTLLEAVKALKPSALIGVSAQGGAFTEEICKEMVKNDANPLIYALSNPTSKAECTAENAYTWTDGKCVFSSGSPFPDVTLPDGRFFVPGQGNNAYIFPGVGLGALAVGASSITQQDFYVTAATLASLVSPERLAQGCCYPPLDIIRSCSGKIAAAVAQNMIKDGRASITLPDAAMESTEGMIAYCEGLMYKPHY